MLGIEPASVVVERFPDGELRPVVDGLGGADVYLVQATGPPVNDHVMELLLLVDACRRAAAGRITRGRAVFRVCPSGPSWPAYSPRPGHGA
ncbi:ribose-phosphate pyrophosphokinase-like domain-containing protein [Nonomuraea wenchangensis]|uniref:ribose-phosphate pyrophosphokinase-like domain-containing protein n=1 Tax=Nonomuraea wenchangensis TaxID=568860 RepID=UPI00332C42A4